MNKTTDNIQNTLANIDTEGLSWVERNFSHPERTIRLATSFSGIGAIEYAFKRLGLKSEIVFAGDIDANCKKAYFANYPIKEEQLHTDIHKLDATPYKGKVDLFVGGAPCQAFSIVGEQRGFEDTRGTLFREFARVVKECQPKVFIFDNVQGLFKHDQGRTWEVVYNTFKDYCGYDVHFQLLNARDYGIPQTRERLYCIGFKKKTKFKYPAPIPFPQKGAYVEVGNRVLIGLVKEDNRLYQDFLNGTATLYYTGRQFPTTIALQDLHFFMPYIKGEGVRDVYEITKVRTITSKEAKITNEDDTESKALRLAFELRYVRKQYANYQPVETNKWIGYTFIDTTFDKLDEFVIIDKL